MNSMPIVLWIAAGGALGSVARHLVNVSAARLIGPDIPWGAVVVNIVGSFLILAIFAGLWLSRSLLQ
jgi:CrcB protein